jgi:hypothetical protein
MASRIIFHPSFIPSSIPGSLTVHPIEPHRNPVMYRWKRHRVAKPSHSSHSSASFYAGGMELVMLFGNCRGGASHDVPMQQEIILLPRLLTLAPLSFGKV